jgi:hypothetical protein
MSSISLRLVIQCGFIEVLSELRRIRTLQTAEKAQPVQALKLETSFRILLHNSLWYVDHFLIVTAS